MPEFIEQLYRKNTSYKGIVFLDRDGTLNKEVTYLHNPHQLEILPSVAEGIRLLNNENIAIVVITNQPAVARGLMTIADLKNVNDYFVSLLRKNNAFIDAIFSCPHHPERDHPDIPKHALPFRIRCECRKPGLAMHKKALSVFGLDTVIGVIGDQTRDIAAGKKLGVPTVLLSTGLAGTDNAYLSSPDYVQNNFLEGVRILIAH